MPRQQLKFLETITYTSLKIKFSIQQLKLHFPIITKEISNYLPEQSYDLNRVFLEIKASLVS